MTTEHDALPDLQTRSKAFAAQHVAELAREIIELQDTAVLPNGRLRELAEMWRTVETHHSLRIAEEAAKRAALELASRTPEVSHAGNWQAVAWGIFDSQGFYEAAIDEESAKKFCEHYNRRSVDPLKPYSYGPLYAFPAPSHAEYVLQLLVDAGHVSADKIELGRAIAAMALGAAPSPDPWHAAVLHECMMTEACYVESDPAQSVRNLIDWHVRAHPATADGNGGKTGHPPGLLQDDDRGLSKWLAGKPDARRRAREAAAAITKCQADRDGDCAHAQCPQHRDNEPCTTGRPCPLDIYEERT